MLCHQIRPTSKALVYRIIETFVLDLLQLSRISFYLGLRLHISAVV